jgi:ribosomal protein S18 acetylase RimI-like enzyme
MKNNSAARPDGDGIILRVFCIEDYDAVVTLWRRSEGVGLNESDTREAIAAFLRRNPRLSFVAQKRGRIIGIVLCGHDGRRGYLHHLAVSKHHRQRGIGRQLVVACLANSARPAFINATFSFMPTMRRAAHRMEFADGTAADANPAGRRPRAKRAFPC